MIRVFSKSIEGRQTRLAVENTGLPVFSERSFRPGKILLVRINRTKSAVITKRQEKKIFKAVGCI